MFLSINSSSSNNNNSSREPKDNILTFNNDVRAHALMAGRSGSAPMAGAWSRAVLRFAHVFLGLHTRRLGIGVLGCIAGPRVLLWGILSHFAECAGGACIGVSKS